MAKNASPLTYISAMSPPFLIQHGDADTTVSVKQSQKLYDALKARNVPAELVIYPNVAHDFVRDGNPDPRLNAQAIAKLESFLAATFPDKPIAGIGPPQIRRDALN